MANDPVCNMKASELNDIRLMKVGINGILNWIL